MGSDRHKLAASGYSDEEIEARTGLPLLTIIELRAEAATKVFRVTWTASEARSYGLGGPSPSRRPKA